MKNVILNIPIKLKDAQIIKQIVEKYVGEGRGGADIKFEKVLKRFNKALEEQIEIVDFYFGK